MSQPSPTRARSDLGVALALVGRDLRRFFRQPSRVVGSLAQPLLLWLVLGAGMGGSFRAPGAEGARYLQYFYPGVVVLTVLFTAIFSTISVIEDRHHGFLQAVLVAPASRTALVLGKTAGGVAVAMLQAAILVLLAPLAGFPLGAMDLPVVAAALVLAATGFTALGFAVAWWIDSTQGYHAIMSVALIPLWMLSGAMFPPTGGLVGAAMKWDPMTYAVAALRRGMQGAALPAAFATGPGAATELGVVAAFAGASLLAAVLLSRSRDA